MNAGTVPTASFRAGNIQYEYQKGGGDAVYLLTPADIKGMDPQGIGDNPNILAIYNNYPQPNDPTQGDGLNTEGYRFPYTLQRSYNTYIARLGLEPWPEWETHTLLARQSAERQRTDGSGLPWAAAIDFDTDEQQGFRGGIHIGAEPQPD